MTDNLVLDFESEDPAIARLKGQLFPDWSVDWIEIKFHIRTLEKCGYLITEPDPKFYISCIVHESVHLLINQALGRDGLYHGWHDNSHFIMNTGLDGFVLEEFPAIPHEKSRDFYNKYVKA